MEAGKLRHRIEIQQLAVIKDSNGDDIEEWEMIYENVPAEHIPASVTQIIAAQAGQTQFRGRFRIRYVGYLDGLDAITRILFNGKIYDVFDWLPDKDSGVVYLTAPYTRGVNRGGF